MDISSHASAVARNFAVGNPDWTDNVVATEAADNVADAHGHRHWHTAKQAALDTVRTLRAHSAQV